MTKAGSEAHVLGQKGFTELYHIVMTMERPVSRYDIACAREVARRAGVWREALIKVRDALVDEGLLPQ
jgi:hypothetical protein